MRNVIRTALRLFQCWLCHCLFPGNKFTTFSFRFLCPCVRQPDISLYNMKLHHTKAPAAKCKFTEFNTWKEAVTNQSTDEIAPNAINMGEKELVGVPNLINIYNVHQWMLGFQILLFNIYIYNVHQWMLGFQILLFNIYIYIMCTSGCWGSKSYCLIYIYI